eukprot:Seg1224.5 transcript_id=Seg1224.5/GoldUCD/mRNA.D3Y31 product="hypothetical protein" protein_id=Seg1224.5/GoldUCD/D3Y31
MEKKSRARNMSKQELLGSNQHIDGLSTNLEMPDDSLSQSSSYFSVIEFDNELIIERAVQLASMLERSARDLKTYSRLAKQKDTQVNDKRSQKIPPRITNNLLPITALWQILCLLALTIVDVTYEKIEKDRNHTLSFNISIGIISAFQLVNLVLVFAATIKLTKQYIHKTASMRFIINGYLSMIVLFAGLYMLAYRFNSKCFVDSATREKKFEYSVVIFIRMLNLSISTGTLCGAASATASEWYSALAMSLQMLISFVYFASFLSQVLSPPNPATVPLKNNNKASHKNTHSNARKLYGSV